MSDLLIGTAQTAQVKPTLPPIFSQLDLYLEYVSSETAEHTSDVHANVIQALVTLVGSKLLTISARLVVSMHSNHTTSQILVLHLPRPLFPTVSNEMTLPIGTFQITSPQRHATSYASNQLC